MRLRHTVEQGLFVREVGAPAAKPVSACSGTRSAACCTFSHTASALDVDAFVSGGFSRRRDDILRTGLDDGAIRGYYASLRQADPRSYHARSCELVVESEACTLTARLAALTYAVLYVAGAPGGISRRSLASLAGLGVRHVTLEPAGHWPFVDQPAAFVEALAAFLPKR